MASTLPELQTPDLLLPPKNALAEHSNESIARTFIHATNLLNSFTYPKQTADFNAEWMLVSHVEEIIRRCEKKPELKQDPYFSPLLPIIEKALEEENMDSRHYARNVANLVKYSTIKFPLTELEQQHQAEAKEKELKEAEAHKLHIAYNPFNAVAKHALREQAIIETIRQADEERKAKLDKEAKNWQDKKDADAKATGDLSPIGFVRGHGKGLTP